MNSPAQDNFIFNTANTVQIEGSKYYEELKAVAERTFEVFYIGHTNFSAEEFWGILKAAKHIKKVTFTSSLIPFFYETDYLEGMTDCKIESINLSSSGWINYGNWEEYQDRFENFIAFISKCGPLVKSLNKLDIGECGISKDKAEKVLYKYKLYRIDLPGIE